MIYADTSKVIILVNGRVGDQFQFTLTKIAGYILICPGVDEAYNGHIRDSTSF